MTAETTHSSKSIKLARETMTGDLRDCLLDFLKHEKNPLPWTMQTETQQQEAIDKVSKAVNHAVEKAVAIIAADGKTVIRGTLVKIQIKDGIQLQINTSKQDPMRHSLVDGQGSAILLVLADKSAYEGERKAAKPDPNQRVLIADDDEG